MRFIYKGASLPDAGELIHQMNSAAQRVYHRLTEAGPSAPRMDDYYRNRYYQMHLEGLAGKLTNCAYHLLWALSSVRKPLGKITLIDHGGGLGFISLVAKEVGVGTVIYNDIDPKFLGAARGIAAVAGAESDHYVLGDVVALIDELKTIAPGLDALVSYDVLEHIYDLDDFFAKLCVSTCCPDVIFASSGANMFSPRYLRYVLPIQTEREFLNRCKRVNIIKECAPNLWEEEIVLICKKTRLLLRKEIEAVVGQYTDGNTIKLPRKRGANSYDPFRSNTVDPETGWWAEHLINPYYLTRALRSRGFQARIMAGFYSGRGAFLNPLIKTLGAPLALPIAPYYTLYAQKNNQPRDAGGPAGVGVG